MRRTGAVLAALVLAATACAGGSDDERLVLVDYSHDVFASFYLHNFPAKMAVHPGTTLVFRQTWTGEPHTVTGGRMVDEALSGAAPMLDFIGAFEQLNAAGVPLTDPEQADPEMSVAEWLAPVEEAGDNEVAQEFLQAWDELAAAAEFPTREEAAGQTVGQLMESFDAVFGPVFEALPWAFDESGDELSIAQNVGQPCYLMEGGPPEDPQEPCDDADQRQPAFDGTHSYYNSGMIPYEGPRGNEFRVQLADDIEPGSYMFYCAVHGPLQSTEVEVQPRNESVPSAEAVGREAREEIREVSRPMELGFAEASEDGQITLNSGDTIEGPFAGIYEDSYGHAAINEFVPRLLEVDAGEAITWKMMGMHTISFNVPAYFPIMEFLDDGTVRFNPQLQPPAGGAPLVPEPDEESTDIPSIDAGTFDGRGFWSSGLIDSWPAPYLDYTVRMSEPGTYRFACLIHPPMVGTVVVR